jgi:hypothetical protein
MRHYVRRIAVFQRTIQSTIIHHRRPSLPVQSPQYSSGHSHASLSPREPSTSANNTKTLFACVMLFSAMCWPISAEHISLKVATYRGNNLIGRHCVRHYDEIWSRRVGGGRGGRKAGRMGREHCEKGPRCLRLPHSPDSRQPLFPLFVFLSPRNNTGWEWKGMETLGVHCKRQSSRLLSDNRFRNAVSALYVVEQKMLHLRCIFLISKTYIWSAEEKKPASLW